MLLLSSTSVPSFEFLYFFTDSDDRKGIFGITCIYHSPNHLTENINIRKWAFANIVMTDTLKRVMYALILTSGLKKELVNTVWATHCKNSNVIIFNGTCESFYKQIQLSDCNLFKTHNWNTWLTEAEVMLYHVFTFYIQLFSLNAMNKYYRSASMLQILLKLFHFFWPRSAW